MTFAIAKVSVVVLTGLAVSYTALVFLMAIQGFAPSICTSFLCRLMNLPRETFGVLILLGVNCLFASTAWFAVRGVTSFLAGRTESTSIPTLANMSKRAGLAMAAMGVGFLLIPIGVAIYYVAFMLIMGVLFSLPLLAHVFFR